MVLLLVLLGCVAEDIESVPVADPYADLLPWCVDLDHDRVGGSTPAPVWEVDAPEGRIRCPLLDPGDVWSIAYDCNDHDYDRAEPLNTGEPGGCGDDPWQT
jgi:hypothetical protein